MLGPDESPPADNRRNSAMIFIVVKFEAKDGYVEGLSLIHI